METLSPPRKGPRPNPGVRPPYGSSRPATPCDLWLAGNEGRPPAGIELRLEPAALGRYPSSADLESKAAAAFGVDADRVLVTAGADDGLLRVCLAFLAPGRELVLPTPTFEMIPRYAGLAGGDVVSVPWPDGSSYPIDAVLAAVTPRTAVIAVVSPNNPTGAVARAEDLARLAAAAPEALIVVDQAYAEFASEDLTAAALELESAVVLRTMSKAYGAAGLRVGFALGAPRLLASLRAAGNPYPVAAASLQVAAARLEDDIAPLVRRVREERRELTELLRAAGLTVLEGEGNFLMVRSPRAVELRDLVAGMGVALRAFPDVPGLEDALRITLPGSPDGFTRLVRALTAALAPDALLFDLDGVLADVSGSYRAAIRATAESFGVALSEADIAAAKAAGDANDDWRLTWRLLRERGVDASLPEVTRRFEASYQGTDDGPGLRATERLLLSREALERLRARRPLAVVTGRPRADALRFLEDEGIADLFDAVVTRDDAPLKPDPEPVRAAMRALGAETAWMLGDTRDDAESARAAGALALGVLPPGGAPAARAALSRQLCAAGAGRCLEATTQLEDLLP